MSFSPLIQNLISAFRCLPSVGPRTAQRMAFYLLERDREGGRQLSTAILEAMAKVNRCVCCRILCETELCAYCSSPTRDRTVLCVVETPADVLAIEHTAGFKGLYFVLMGHLSPLDGIGPEDIGVSQFRARLIEGEIQEVILATNPTVEGEATAHYLGEIVKERSIRASRIAYGVPLGGELEFLDGGTLSRALMSRSVI
jgi:recombination protein RecR